ncbi:MAG: aminotransferase class V-fold PLP-dependent enzyme [Dehalococcoidia bacterium]|nr:aminotransferase class V-fold PLP-dependent enzyme [Dehalococcoidia bacterium]
MATFAARSQASDLEVRRPLTPGDYDAIRRLNEAVFAREIRQHEPSSDGRLVDPFEERSHFYTAWRGDELVGMVCYGTGKDGPFSIDAKLDDPSILDAYRAQAIEIRLLAVTPGERMTRACWLMLRDLARDAVAEGYRYALISGIDSQQRLYQRAGFEAIGPAVRRGNALFTPMMLTFDRFIDFGRTHAHLDLLPEDARGRPLLLTPGPVAVHEDVRAALVQAVDLHHRSPAFRALLASINERLRRLCSVPADTEVVLAGAGGTGATEMLMSAAGQIGPVLVVSNGHFGDRLASMAADLGVPVTKVHYAPDRPLPTAEVEAALAASGARTVAVVDMETSVGCSNRAAVLELRDLTRRHGAFLLVDAVSSFGGEPDDAALLAADAVATVSGKALGGVPGAAILFVRRAFLEARTLPARAHALSIDRHLEAWRQRGDLPFTPPIQAFAALGAALEVLERDGLAAKQARQSEAMSLVESALRALGCTPVPVFAPSATTRTWRPPGAPRDTAWAMAQLAARGLQAYQNERYHRPIEVFQTSVMGCLDTAELSSRLRRPADQR